MLAKRCTLRWIQWLDELFHIRLLLTQQKRYMKILNGLWWPVELLRGRHSTKTTYLSCLYHSQCAARFSLMVIKCHECRSSQLYASFFTHFPINVVAVDLHSTFTLSLHKKCIIAYVCNHRVCAYTSTKCKNLCHVTCPLSIRVPGLFHPGINCLSVLLSFQRDTVT